GLAVGLADSLKSRGGVWLGWDGEKLDGETPEGNRGAEPQIKTIGKVQQVIIPLSEEEYDEYYLGFSNSVLWPLFHYRLDLVDYRSSFLDAYRQVNAKFADTLVPLLEPDDLVWVHDYHLIPLAAELRQRGCQQRIGFFLHIPFPSPEILVAAPRHRWLVESLLEYDVLGFQTQTDLGNLQRYVEGQLNIDLGIDGFIKVGGRNVLAGCFPIGIDVDAFAEMAQRPNEEVQIETN